MSARFAIGQSFDFATSDGSVQTWTIDHIRELPDIGGNMYRYRLKFGPGVTDYSYKGEAELAMLAGLPFIEKVK